MNTKDKEDHYTQTQTTSSPGAMGEESNRRKNEVDSASEKSAQQTSLSEGLNEEKSQGTEGAYEGLENMEED